MNGKLNCSFVKHTIAGFCLVALLVALPSFACQEVNVDVSVAGGTPGGVSGAGQAARMGKNVALVALNNHPAGMTSGGLGQTGAKFRMEPVFMILSRAAGTAAGFAIDDGVSVQDVKIAELPAKLTADGRRLQANVGASASGLSVAEARISIRGARVVAFGDSITLGYGVPSTSNWVARLQSRFGLVMVNAGVSGNTSAQGLARIQTDVLNQNPNFVIINFGMNDHVMTNPNAPKVNQSQFRANLHTMVDRVRAIHAIPILVTANYIIEGDATQYYYSRHPASYYSAVGGAQAWLDSYLQIVREIAAQERVDLVDVRAACDHYSRYAILRSLANGAKVADGVHPYLAGSEVYARLIGDYLAAHYP